MERLGVLGARVGVAKSSVINAHTAVQGELLLDVRLDVLRVVRRTVGRHRCEYHLVHFGALAADLAVAAEDVHA